MSPEPKPPPSPPPPPPPPPTPGREAEVVALTVAAAAVVESEAAASGASGGRKCGSRIMLVRRIGFKPGGGASQGIGRPSVYHAVVVIFLEFFAWGLLTTPMLTVLHKTFPQHTFLMNGLIQGVKGFLSFMSAPLIGALSDVWGRKYFLLITVFFTCVPIPLMKISPWWYFAMISVSGIFAVTFSVIFAYVADITQEHERSTAYGLVSATFAASLVTSPAIGAHLSNLYGDNLVVLVATVVAVVDICFILLAVPESLPEKMRPPSWGALISWEQADPFASLRKVGKDSTILLTCITVFLSYLPEAGQYSSFFLYLRQVIKFEYASIATFIAVVGILSIVAQTVFLSILMRSIGNKNTVLLGLGFQMFQLAWYGFGSQPWMMWAAGAVAAMSSITFPAISALVSRNADSDQQGVVQGIITGIRGLCNGLGPALYGFIFFLFHVELNELAPVQDKAARQDPSDESAVIPGPPFLFGACAVLLAFLVALFIPEHSKAAHTRKHSNSINSIQSNSPDRGSEEDIEPLLQDSSV
ncbi:hippocampus abundant transcript-like protein 1 isoform X3 [Python bivittatus]|uniref:Hippocampus abundant transcript 1 protein n=1 Tax=Python bivittatus TaxID=176946 RepID=A0A9F5MU47_PYTBI|nr:hippocampus abundant transcript-like protein 1 isoform X1 [Python bivittatus]XP_025024320.1 hippocampus abundant transcript-like protein 1 isoform X2 [Python bivittatus]XP_025024321.1 hippocampus abundant transcript-like protein 1 isoform X3 [Python bivittatus]